MPQEKPLPNPDKTLMKSASASFTRRRNHGKVRSGLIPVSVTMPNSRENAEIQ